MRLSVHLTHPREGKSLPKELVTTSWCFEDLSVPDALRRVAEQLEVPAQFNKKGELLEPARGLTENVVVWVERTDLP